ncbi:hypothetical protein EDD68_11087, partial [Melghiribacillus thermohalophilus]
GFGLMSRRFASPLTEPFENSSCGLRDDETKKNANLQDTLPAYTKFLTLPIYCLQILLDIFEKYYW